jgi:hypothetical protein
MIKNQNDDFRLTGGTIDNQENLPSWRFAQKTAGNGT